jgi:hypothetical protein
MGLLKPGNPDRIKNFLDNRLTDDFEFEDPIERFVGKEEFADFLYLCKFINDVDFKVPVLRMLHIT